MTPSPGDQPTTEFRQSIYESAVRQLGKSEDALTEATKRFMARMTLRRESPKLDLSAEDLRFLKSIGVSAD